MIRQGIALAFGLLFVSGCTYFADRQAPETTGPAMTGAYEMITFKGKRATRAEAARCEVAGGSVEPGGMLGYDQCVQTYADAGMSCMSAADCMGRCLLSPDSDDDVDQMTDDGICQTTDSPFGCYAEVDEGKVQWAICVD
tara:strand:- start:1780 stop:2199 length:420 start_codon:yes stop_codon:yes gene_type:complete